MNYYKLKHYKNEDTKTLNLSHFVQDVNMLVQ